MKKIYSDGQGRFLCTEKKKKNSIFNTMINKFFKKKTIVSKVENIFLILCRSSQIVVDSEFLEFVKIKEASKIGYINAYNFPTEEAARIIEERDNIFCLIEDFENNFSTISRFVCKAKECKKNLYLVAFKDNFYDFKGWPKHWLLENINKTIVMTLGEQMGYRIDEDTIKTNLFIDRNDFSNAFVKAKNIILQQQAFWRVEKEEVLNATNLEKLIGAMRWEPKFDVQGNIIAIYNYGLNVADEELLFNSIAPFVKTGSFVEYERESYSGKQRERFEFKNGTVSKKNWVYKNKEQKMENNGFLNDKQNKGFASMRKGGQVLEATQGFEDLKMKTAGV